MDILVTVEWYIITIRYINPVHIVRSNHRVSSSFLPSWRNWLARQTVTLPLKRETFNLEAVSSILTEGVTLFFFIFFSFCFRISNTE